MQNFQGRSKAGKVKNQTRTELKRNTNKNIYIDIRYKKNWGADKDSFSGVFVCSLKARARHEKKLFSSYIFDSEIFYHYLLNAFLMQEASSKRDCLCVCPSVRHICKIQKNTREKVHIVSARDISTFLCVEKTVSENLGHSLSTRNSHLDF